jgi:hypothetical protein
MEPVEVEREFVQAVLLVASSLSLLAIVCVGAYRRYVLAPRKKKWLRERADVAELRARKRYQVRRERQSAGLRWEE